MPVTTLNLIDNELCGHLTMTKMLNTETTVFSLDCLDFEITPLNINTGCIQTPEISFSNAFDDRTRFIGLDNDILEVLMSGECLTRHFEFFFVWKHCADLNTKISLQLIKGGAKFLVGMAFLIFQNEPMAFLIWRF